MPVEEALFAVEIQLFSAGVSVGRVSVASLAPKQIYTAENGLTPSEFRNEM